MQQAQQGNVTALMKRISIQEHQNPASGSPSAQALYSSLRNDAANGYTAGKTLNILLGTGAAALILAGLSGFALPQGMIQLPKFPF